MLRFLYVSIIAFVWTNSCSQVFNRNINAYDENGRRNGLWITYWDDDETITMSKAKFKNGYEKGASKQYNQNGKLRLKTIYYKNKLRVKHNY